MKKIAVIEDNPDNRLLVQAILEDDYEINEFETGIEALEAFEHEKPDLILLDICLPEMDGPEVLERIRSDESLKGVPIIALTAHAMEGDREKFLNAGFDDYLKKPIIDEAVLVATIEKWLNAS